MAQDGVETKLSVCIIAKDEEKNIENVIRDAKRFADEIVVVDTGSKDRTPKIARELGAKVYFFKWNDNFADARNYSIEKATGNWILWLDADDRVPEEEAKKIAEFKKHLHKYRDTVFYFLIESREEDKGTWYWFQLRLFPKIDGLRFEGRVHEQISLSAEKLGLKHRNVNIKIIHTGYTDPKKITEKMKRNLRLLEMEEKENPDAWWVKKYIASSYKALGRIREAVKKFEEALEKCDSDYWKVDILISLAETYADLQQFDRALELLEEAEGILRDEGYINLVKAEILLRKGEWEEALDEVNRAMAKGFTISLLPVSRDMIEKRVFIAKSKSLFQLELYSKAINYFRKIWEKWEDVREQIEFVSMFSEALLNTGQWREAKKILENFVKTDAVQEVVKGKCSVEPMKAKALASLFSNYALCLEREGEHAMAVEYYKRALNLDPENYKIAFNLAHLLYIKKDLLGALENFARYLKNCKPDEEDEEKLISTLITIGNIYLNLGQFEKSVEPLDLILKLLGLRVEAKSITDLSLAWRKVAESVSNSFLKAKALENAFLLLKFADEPEASGVALKLASELDKIKRQVGGGELN